MKYELLLVIGLLLASIGMFVANKPRMDVVALLVIVVLPLFGIISVPEALAGFSDPNVLLIAALFVIGEGLVRTGNANQGRRAASVSRLEISADYTDYADFFRYGPHTNVWRPVTVRKFGLGASRSNGRRS
jgi:Citrate transporter